MKKIIAATSAVFILSGCWSTSADYYTKQVPEEEKKAKEQEEADNLEKKEEEAEELETKKEAEEKRKSEEDFKAFWSDPNYDYYAYKLTTRTESERNGNTEYRYTGYLIDSTSAETHGVKQSPVTEQADESFSFWRYDVEFTPKALDIIQVKFPKGKHDEYIDVRGVYRPLGEYYW